jgi:hypothetical protein
MKALRTIAAVLACCAIAAPGAWAHSASDAYLTLDAQADGSVRGQWDIALRDLDFVLELDDDGDGNITWAEVRRHQPAIGRYVLERLSLLGDGRPCKLTLLKQMIDKHADGAYAALFFELRCAAAPTRLTLSYRLFFDIDPSHRAILVAHNGADTSTAVLAPQNAKIDLKLAPQGAAASSVK